MKTNTIAEICPAERALELLARKWAIKILITLYERDTATRFGELQRAISPITQKELTKHLRELEKAGVVHRTVYAEVPPRVEYEITELGKSLAPSLTLLSEWIIKNNQTISLNLSKNYSGSD